GPPTAGHDRTTKGGGAPLPTPAPGHDPGNSGPPKGGTPMADFKQVKSLAARGKVTRREFIQLALASGLTVAAADTLFNAALAQTPKRGGKLKMALGHGSTTDSLDPATYPDQYTRTVCWWSMSNSLTEIDAKGNIVGDLA